MIERRGYGVNVRSNHPRGQPNRRLTLPSTFVMHRFLKSKSPVDIPAPTQSPSPSVELVGDLASRKDSRTLAATSSAIALSLGSAHNTNETSSDGTTVLGRGAGWQTAYGAARMAVEIAKESSDMFLPLKAVVGAVSVLIKNYDVSMSSSYAECILTLCLFSAPANIR